MAGIVYRTNQKTGVEYAYCNESCRGLETKKPKTKRTCLGRVDPIANVIVEKGKEGKRNQSKLPIQEKNEAHERSKILEEGDQSPKTDRVNAGRSPQGGIGIGLDCKTRHGIHESRMKKAV